jgi:hypothetical protein
MTVTAELKAELAGIGVAVEVGGSISVTCYQGPIATT